MDNNTKAAVGYVSAGLVALGLIVAGNHLRKKLKQRKDEVVTAPEVPVALLDNVVSLDEVRSQKTGKDRFQERYGNTTFTAKKDRSQQN